MHCFLALAILSAIIGLHIPAVMGGVITLGIATFYFKEDLNRINILQSVVFISLRYTANLALLLGGLLGGAKLGMQYISSTFDDKS